MYPDFYYKDVSMVLMHITLLTYCRHTLLPLFNRTLIGTVVDHPFLQCHSVHVTVKGRKFKENESGQLHVQRRHNKLSTH
jgi:hypothetical protein